MATPQRAPTPSRRRPRDRKQQIARAAAELFHARGYHRVGVDEVAAVVGISGPAIYRHFRGKHALLADVLLEGAQHFHQRLDDSSTLDHAWRSFVEAGLERRDFSALWQREIRHLEPAERHEVLRLFRVNVDRLVVLLLGARPGFAHEDAVFLVRAGIAVAASPSFHRVELPGDRLETLLTELAMTTCAVGLSPPTFGSPRVARQPVARATRRERILDAAIRLFNERGLPAVTLEEIGAAAGIAGPSVYRHFASKDDILDVALFRGAEALHVSAAQALAEGGTPRETLHRVVRGYIDSTTGFRDLYGALFVEARHLPEERRRAMRRAQSDYVAEWVRLRQLVADGEPAAESAVRVHAMLGVANLLTQTPRLSQRPALKDDLVAVGHALLG